MSALSWLARFPEPAAPLQLDVQIPNTRFGTGGAQDGDQANHPHLCDVYTPGGTIRTVMVALHGGGGTKQQYAGSLNVLLGDPPSYGRINWGLLQKARCALVVPQGQACTGVNALWGAGNNPWNPSDVSEPLVRAWSSRVFWSGHDDPQFLRDMAAWIIATFGADKKRVLVGHSAGGMMVCRAWAEHASLATGYHAYCTSSATPSAYFRDVAPTPPADARPFAADFGAQDTNLAIAPDGAGFDAASLFLSANPTDAWVSWPDQPELNGPIAAHQARVNAYNTQAALPPESVSIGSGTTSAAAIGTKTEWVNAGGKMRLRMLSAADHSNRSQQEAAGQDQLLVWSLFGLAQG